MMDYNADRKQGISDAERAAIRKALVIYYSGKSQIADAFAQVEPGLKDRYYRRKKKFPDEIERINAEARAIAVRERSGDQLAYESRQFLHSMELQRIATAGLREALPELVCIACGEARTIYDEAKDSERTVIVYPRNQIGAATLLQSIARDGVRLEGHVWESASAMAKSTDDGPMLPLLPVRANFSSLQAKTPDGRTFTATVEKGDIIITEVDHKTEDEAGTDEPAVNRE